MKIHEMEQGTEYWCEVRRGKITGSRVAELLVQNKQKTAFGQKAVDYIHEKAVEIITGEIAEQFSSAATRWGTENEPNAFDAYSAIEFIPVHNVGFCEMNEYVGASPDGVIFTDDGQISGIIEIKCPYNSVNHYRTLVSGEIPKIYLPQVAFNTWVTGAEYCDFVSFDPRFPEHLKTKIIRFERKENLHYIKKIAEIVEEAVEVIKNTVIELAVK